LFSFIKSIFTISSKLTEFKTYHPPIYSAKSSFFTSVDHRIPAY